MPQLRTGYDLNFHEICPGEAALGSATVIPWDSDLFGFPVASYRIGAPCLDPEQQKAFESCFQDWMKSKAISMCSCVTASSDDFWRKCLPGIGFRVVDLSLRVTLGLTAGAHLPKPRLEVRPAEPEDYSEIEAIAAGSFNHGRYHADPFFPKDLASRRYAGWIRNALSGTRPEDRVFVLGKPGQVMGFYHVTIEQDTSDLRLAAAAPRLKGTGIGAELYISTLHHLQKLGVRRVVSTISSANTTVMNIYAFLNFRFSDPELIYHWHSPDFPVSGRGSCLS